jgi:hypothetical protein
VVSLGGRGARAARLAVRKLAFTALALALAGSSVFAVAELALRLTGDAPLYMAHPVLGGTLRPSIRSRYKRADVDQEILTNAHGLHDEEYPLEKPAGTKRVLVIGDSYVEALQVGIPDTFSKQLQQRLTRVQVVNAGRSGRGVLENYLYLRHAGWSFAPDVVVLAFVMNDVDDDWSRRSLIEMDAQGRPVRFREQGLSPLPLWFKAILHRSWAVYRLIETASLAWHALRRGAAGAAAGAAAPAPAQVPDQFRILRADYDADTKSAWAFTSKILETMNAECRARKVPLVLMVVPMETAFDERATATTRTWNITRQTAEKPHAILAELCSTHGIPLLDLLPGFRASPVRPLHVEEGHWNVAGNKLAAELASGFLLRPGLLAP